MAGVSTLRNIFTVGGFTAVSRVLGLVREMLQSRLIGAGVEQSAFTLAFAIPNMARKLFGEGALTAAFVPVFKGEVERGAVESARRLARAVMTTVLLILGATVILTVAGLTAFLDVPALAADLSARSALTLRLVRILFPYMIFICGAAFGMGVLNALGRFVEGAFMPAMLNVIWIATLGGLCFFPGLEPSVRVTVVCWAILAGGLAQMLFLFRCMARRGYSPRLSFDGFRDEKTRLVWKNTVIAAVGAGAVQINYMLDQVLAQVASPWAAGVIGYAERLMDLPLGVIGVAFGTVLLPTFAGLFAKGDVDGARAALSSSVVQLMTAMIPAAAGLCVLAPEITAVIYEGNAFDAVATMRVSRALAVYSLGLAFFGYQKSIIPWFQAQNDMKTPLRVSVTTVILNATLNILAVFLLPVEWRHVGLAVSTVVCALAGCVLLTIAARRKNGRLGLASACLPVVKMLVAALGMACVLWILRPHLSGFGRYAALAILISVGMAVYGVSAIFFRLRLRPRRIAVIAGILLTATAATARDFDVRAYGATGDGATMDTAALQKAIDACAAVGGGRVVLSEGRFLSGTISLKSGVELHLEASATLLGSRDCADFPERAGLRHVESKNLPRERNACFIWAEEAHDIAITGRGTIDCQGDAFVRKAEAGDGAWAPFVRIPGLLTPPRVVFFAGCRDVRLTDVTMVNQPSGWSYWLTDCDRVWCDRLRIDADLRYPNNDGIHVNCSRDVFISNCFISTCDDAIVVRANSRALKSPRPCARVHITNCSLRSTCACIRIGYLNDGVVRDCVFSNLTMYESGRGIRMELPPFKIKPDRGCEASLIENLSFSNIEMRNVRNPIHFVIAQTPETQCEAVRDIHFSHVRATGGEQLVFRGRPTNPLERLTFSDCSFTTSKPTEMRHCVDFSGL